MMEALQLFTLEGIRSRLKDGNLPFTGTTPLGSAYFRFSRKAPSLAVVLHSGSRVRAGLKQYMEVTENERFREEDPYMDRYAEDFPIQLIALDSRFEYDLNRDMEDTIYPADRKKWGLQVWKQPLPESEVEITFQKYREFHTLLDIVIEWLLDSYRQIILFDLHSFCYRREADIHWWEDERPEINLGTRAVNREYFSPLIDLFLKEVSGMTVEGYPVRTGENQAFGGGYLTRKYARVFNRQVLVLAVEYKKIFMDECTGKEYPEILEMFRKNLVDSRDRLLQVLTGWPVNSQ
jgi:N-formylglutamate deformylase